MAIDNIVEESYLNQPSIQHGMSGIYIVFEGPFRSGKSTQAEMLYEALKELYPEREIILTREPGGTEASEDFRTIVQGKIYDPPISPKTEAYGYASARSELLDQIVKPALERGAIVISDRSYLSSCAFQGGGKGLGIETVYKINEVAVSNIVPDYVAHLDITYEEALQRQSDAEGDKHELEGPEFVKAVRDTYTKLSKRPELKDKWNTLDGSGTVKELHKEIKKAVTDFLQSH